MIGHGFAKCQPIEMVRGVRDTCTSQPLVAYRVGGELVVARDVCAHRGKTRLFAPIARNFDKDLPVEEVHAARWRIGEDSSAWALVRSSWSNKRQAGRTSDTPIHGRCGLASHQWGDPHIATR